MQAIRRDGLTPLTAGHENSLYVAQIEHIEAVPEYPETRVDGFAYIVNVRNMQAKDVKQLMSEVHNPFPMSC